MIPEVNNIKTLTFLKNCFFDPGTLKNLENRSSTIRPRNAFRAVPRMRYTRNIFVNCGKRNALVVRMNCTERRNEINGNSRIAKSSQCSLQYAIFFSATDTIRINSIAKASQMIPVLTCSSDQSSTESSTRSCRKNSTTKTGRIKNAIAIIGKLK